MVDMGDRRGRARAFGGLVVFTDRSRPLYRTEQIGKRFNLHIAGMLVARVDATMLVVIRRGSPESAREGRRMPS